MPKLSSNLGNPLQGRIPNPKLGGRARSPFLSDWLYPRPAIPRGGNRGKKDPIIKILKQIGGNK